MQGQGGWQSGQWQGQGAWPGSGQGQWSGQGEWQGQGQQQGGQWQDQGQQQGQGQRWGDNDPPGTHNGNFAWNGQPIPTFAPVQGAAASRNTNGQYPQAPGSSGNPNAPYGMRNTGINNADARNVGFQGGYTGYNDAGQPVQFGTYMRDGTQYGAGPHTIDPNKAIIQAVHYRNGAIAAVQFQNGQVVDIATAIGMAEAGLIEDVNTGKNREGQKTLRSYPDGYPNNNLSNLPRF